MWLNKIGPYHNPMETYSYYDLPFCAPEKRLEPRTKFAGLGEVLEGVEYVNSDLAINFNGASVAMPAALQLPKQAQGCSTWACVHETPTKLSQFRLPTPCIATSP